MDSKPLVSIITITFNSEKYLARTMQSVLSQSYRLLEYWIIDGGSTDRSLEIAASFKDERVHIVSEKDAGIADAMNKGVRRARGEIIGIIHSDDFFTSDAVEKSVDAMSKSGRAWSYGQAEVIDSEGRSLYVCGQGYSLSKLQRFMLIPHPSVFARREMYENFGAFDSQYRLSMDYDLCLRFAREENPVYIPNVLAKMTTGGASSKDMKSKLAVANEVYRIKRRRIRGSLYAPLFYLIWTDFKILVFHLLASLPFTKNLIELLRKAVNPNLLNNHDSNTQKNSFHQS